MTIPKLIEANVLFDNDHTCCICNQKGKDVQIHHIDGDDQNNVPSNLAVLCLECHSKATGQRGFGRKYSESEVRKYKRYWEFTVRKRRRIFEKHAPLKRKDWVEFEISGFIFELAVTRNLERAREILDLLYIHSLFGQVFLHNSTFILDELHNLVPFISSPEKSALVAEYVLHYFWHLPGPTYAKIKPADTRALRKAIDLLTWIAEFETLARRDSMPIVSSLTSLSELFETAHSYRQRDLKEKILQAIKSIKKEVSEKRGYGDAEMAPLVNKTNIVLKRLAQVYKSNTKNR